MSGFFFISVQDYTFYWTGWALFHTILWSFCKINFCPIKSQVCPKRENFYPRWWLGGRHLYLPIPYTYMVLQSFIFIERFRENPYCYLLWWINLFILTLPVSQGINYFMKSTVLLHAVIFMPMKMWLRLWLYHLIDYLIVLRTHFPQKICS